MKITHVLTTLRILLAHIIFFLAISGYGQDQDGPYKVLIESIESLESVKDPKCYATASRLEDFMFGTALTDEARDERINSQKNLARYIWSKASDIATAEGISEQNIIEISDQTIDFRVINGNWYLGLADGTGVLITQRDYEHYSSVAYSLRAILAIQQENLFSDSRLKLLSPKGTDRLKFIIDLVTIGALNIADQLAREKNRYEISKADLDIAWNSLVKDDSIDHDAGVHEPRLSDYALTLQVIDQKMRSYEQYNGLSQKVFLRNVQVYFAQVPWPKDSISSNQLTIDFQNILIEFTSKLLQDAQKIALENQAAFVSRSDVRKALNKLLPHEFNQFEDVTFFNKLDDQKVVIEAYDLDAFRDSGIHWNYLQASIYRSAESLVLEPDPFALELLVEGIAHMGVLLWRQAGLECLEMDLGHLSPEHLNLAFKEIKKLSKDHHAKPIDENTSDENYIAQIKKEYGYDLFSDETKSANVIFEHRTSDWLNRQIRSYLVNEGEGLVRLAIPPAFGGGGVAAEDIDNDGFADLLFLGGKGIKLLKNTGTKSFIDITQNSGLEWHLEDGNYAEPRQPIITDFDNDGEKDVFITYVNDNHRLFKGNGDGTFEDVSEFAQLGGKGLVGGPATALDFNRDGLLDIYIGYFGNYLAGDLPTLKRHNDNGSPNKLFINKGNFQFEDVSEGSGITNTGWTQAAGHADINNDGWQDIIVGNDFGINAYYLNNRDGTFSDKSTELGVDKPSYTMNVGLADLNSDDLPDFYISNIVVMEKDDKYSAPNASTTMHFDPEVLGNMRVVEANDLFISQGNKKAPKYTLSKSIGRGYNSTGWSWDADFFDYDNDGDDDLYCLNGMNQYSVYGSDNPYYESPEGESMKDVVFAASKEASNVFFENNEGFLQNRSRGSGLDLVHTSRSAAYLDYDNDGDLDIAINNYNGPAFFYENKSEEFGNNWLAIDLKSTGQTLIGTIVKVKTAEGKKIWRQVSSTTGYLSGHPSRVHIGLGKASKCSVEVRWPDGSKTNQKIDRVNKLLSIEKPN